MEPMKISNAGRAQILVQALPYIQRLAGKTIVVKYGGNAMINEDLKNAVMNDIVMMKALGINVVLVHGGGPEINAMLKKIGKESRFVNGMRYTDEETMEVVQQVLAGKVNKALVQLLAAHNGRAVGLCGLDGDMLMADKLVSGKCTPRLSKMPPGPGMFPSSPRWPGVITGKCTTSMRMWRRPASRPSWARASCC